MEKFWFVYDILLKRRGGITMSSDSMLKQYIPFWERLSKQEIEQLLSNISVSSYSEKELVHSGESDCVGILIVVKGRLRVFMLSKDGREITLFHMEEGEVCVLSASCIVGALTFPICIEAAENTGVININTDFFEALARENIYVENFMYKTAMMRFSQVMWVMEQVLFSGMDKRVAQFLLDEQEEGCVRMTHEEIAKHIGTAREVVSRMLKYFEQEGWVLLKRGTVLLKDGEALAKL